MSATHEEQIQFIKDLYPYAIKIDVHIKAVMGQAAEESGWGTSPARKNALNFFGITKGSWTGPTFSTDNDTYRKYDSIAACLQDYVKILSESRYSSSWSLRHDWEAFLNQVGPDGWNSHSDYAGKVIACARDVENLAEEALGHKLFPDGYAGGGEGLTADDFNSSTASTPTTTLTNKTYNIVCNRFKKITTGGRDSEGAILGVIYEEDTKKIICWTIEDDDYYHRDYIGDWVNNYYHVVPMGNHWTVDRVGADDYHAGIQQMFLKFLVDGKAFVVNGVTSGTEIGQKNTVLGHARSSECLFHPGPSIKGGDNPNTDYWTLGCVLIGEKPDLDTGQRPNFDKTKFYKDTILTETSLNVLCVKNFYSYVLKRWQVGGVVKIKFTETFASGSDPEIPVVAESDFITTDEGTSELSASSGVLTSVGSGASSTSSTKRTEAKTIQPMNSVIEAHKTTEVEGINEIDLTQLEDMLDDGTFSGFKFDENGKITGLKSIYDETENVFDYTSNAGVGSSYRSLETPSSTTQVHCPIIGVVEGRPKVGDANTTPNPTEEITSVHTVDTTLSAEDQQDKNNFNKENAIYDVDESDEGAVDEEGDY